MTVFYRGVFCSSHADVLCKKGVLKKFHKIHEETPVPEPATLLKKRL